MIGPTRRGEKVIEGFLFFAAISSVGITLGIVLILVGEALSFFRHVALSEFLTETMWTPLFAVPKYGILPLLCGTLMTTLTALVLAFPLGTIIAVYLSEFASSRVRDVVKPMLEILSAIPTVVYGYFALTVLTPILQWMIPDLPTFSVLSAGLAMGIMIIPYVSSLSEDALRSVPSSLRDASLALAANKFQTAFKVVYPSALSGIAAAYILGISRAVGETMIVAIAAGMQPNLSINPTEPAATMTAFIVQVSMGDLPHGSIGYQSIFAVGLVLFLLTFSFNLLGFGMKARYRQAYR